MQSFLRYVHKIKKKVSPKNFAKKLAFFAQTTASFCKNGDHITYPRL
jgi:hypothetical protein